MTTTGALEISKKLKINDNFWKLSLPRMVIRYSNRFEILCRVIFYLALYLLTSTSLVFAQTAKN